jgi:hypothetical protein
MFRFVGRAGSGVGVGDGKRTTTMTTDEKKGKRQWWWFGMQRGHDGQRAGERRSRGNENGDDETRQGEREGAALVKLYAEAAAAAAAAGPGSPHRPSHGRLFFFMGGGLPCHRLLSCHHKHSRFGLCAFQLWPVSRSA